MTVELPAHSTAPPEQGQLAELRNRLWVVGDVIRAENSEGERATRVDLECLDDDRLGEMLSVIWEREVNASVIFADTLPIPSDRWDSPNVFDAFLTAVRWTASAALDERGLLAPFHGAIEIEPYQLEPVARAVRAPRVNLLIADDVGLGKTTEAGLVLQELLSRARIRNCVIVCPASLQRQWQEEIHGKFNLRFDIIDRGAILRLRREYGTHVNPWHSFPRLITSMDFLKAERHLGAFLAPDERGNPPRWDLLILDEAHHCAPSGRTRYIHDSQRTKMLRRIAPHFDHRLFLTATPHNGFTESFTALLEMLDPLRFTVSEDARVELLRRLALLNRERHEEALAQDLHDKKAPRKSARNKKSPQPHPARTTQPTLFDEPQQQDLYTLAYPESQAAEPPAPFDSTTLSPPAHHILHYLQTHPGWHAPTELMQALDLTRSQWAKSLTELATAGVVDRRGQKRGTMYRCCDGP